MGVQSKISSYEWFDVFCLLRQKRSTWDGEGQTCLNHGDSSVSSKLLISRWERGIKEVCKRRSGQIIGDTSSKTESWTKERKKKPPLSWREWSASDLFMRQS